MPATWRAGGNSALFRSLTMALVATAWGPTALAQAQPEESSVELSRRVTQLAALVETLQARINELEAKAATQSRSVFPAPVLPATETTVATPVATPASTPVATLAAPATGLPRTGNALPGGTTVNFLFDGYYGFNFNNPIGRVNLLRAYDVSSNAFSLNQADLVFENAPDLPNGKRFGLRLDLQFGQATAASQGSAMNEPRPEVYRNVFQAYGTYIVPVGSGLRVDFGKWASSLGIEGNYTKDQMNYSRSFLFTLLPFYHMGARLNYQLGDAVDLSYWITNGTQQTEPFNGFKDQMFGFTVRPARALSWAMNYYLGQEHPDVQFLPNYAGTNLPTEQGLAFQPVLNAPGGKLHILDTYLNWQASSRLTLALEGDYVIQRLFNWSAPAHTLGSAAYARYQLTTKYAIAARTEYLSDRGGLFSGTTQALKENTITLERRIAEGFIMRAEWRRDSSNHRYFLTDTPGILKKEQSTATLGVVWWLGGKEGAW